MNVQHRCWAEVDLDALRGNLGWIRHRVGPDVKIMTVVKADAYGHGLKQIAALLMQSGTDIFGVANLAEAHAIRTVGRGWPILMLGACLPHEIASAVRDEVRPTLSSLAEARAFSAEARRQKKLVAVHVKVDTGMGRLGVPVGCAVDLIRAASRLPGLTVEGLFTHYAAVEDAADFSEVQSRRFREVVAQVVARGFAIPLIHATSSGGLLHQPETMFNLVRPGLLVYGIVPRGQRRLAVRFREHVRPALAFKCRVSLVKEIPKGTSLSYGRTFIAPRKMRVATLTAGYGDGYMRAGSNRAEVLVRGKRCRVLGRITMDQMLVDVSRVPSARSGDEAVLIGSQRRESITAEEVADWCGTIPWEVLTAITYRVPRLYRGGHAS